MSGKKSPSTPRMAGDFKKASAPNTSTGRKPDRIFKKDIRKLSSYDDAKISEISHTQARELHIAQKIDRYYDKHRTRLEKKEYNRLSRSSLQTHLKYGPPGAQRSLSEYYKHQARVNVRERQDARLERVSRISKRNQWRVVESSRVMRERQKFRQEQKNYLTKQFGLSVYKPNL